MIVYRSALVGMEDPVN